MKKGIFLTPVVLLLLILAAVAYVIFARPELLPKGLAPDLSVQKLQIQSSSDEVSTIESDLKTTDLSDLDRELSEIESELSR